MRATCFCGPAPAGFPTRGFPRPGCYPTPCSMECGLSSIPRLRAEPRPSGQPEVIFIIPFLGTGVNHLPAENHGFLKSIISHQSITMCHPEGAFCLPRRSFGVRPKGLAASWRCFGANPPWRVGQGKAPFSMTRKRILRKPSADNLGIIRQKICTKKMNMSKGKSHVKNHG